MKITKLAHACLLAEMPEPANRTVLFDPSDFSAELIEAINLKHLDDIVITHEHFDHFSLPLVQKLMKSFPDVRILAPGSVVNQLADAGIKASSTPSKGMELFDAPHELVEPLFETPQSIGVHYLDRLTHPGDSYSFKDSKQILALPMTAPWGATVDGIKLAVALKPQYVIPIHDWMWKDVWKAQMYDGIAGYLSQQGITFIKAVDGESFTLG